jgi:hypothetical protein
MRWTLGQTVNTSMFNGIQLLGREEGVVGIVVR